MSTRMARVEHLEGDTPAPFSSWTAVAGSHA
jgi:hypothetical protein